MRGVGGVCEMCMCLALGGAGGERVSEREDWIWDVHLCLGYGGFGGSCWMDWSRVW